MEYKITAASCCSFSEPFKLVEKYGESFWDNFYTK